MRAGSRALVFIGTGYLCLLGLVNYIDYISLNKEDIINEFGEGTYAFLQTGVPFLMVIGGLGLSYGVSKFYGHFYNKIAEMDFKERLKKEITIQ